MSNLYHIIDFIPGMEREEMLVGSEDLAQALVKSGLFRVDTGGKINFARLYIPNLNISMMISYREIYDKSLLPKTLETISKKLEHEYKGKALKQKLEFYISKLKDELRKYQQPTLEEELKLARLLVQAAHPVVLMLALEDRTQIFLSHSHSIGDMMDVVDWHRSGSNSGMQSTDGREVAVFVSCGGDPLTPNEDPKAQYGNGWPAIARLIIIAGQELGHYSDIMRDSDGRQVKRYSSNFNGTKASEEAKVGRLHDIARSEQIFVTLKACGLEKLVTIEKAVKFYEDNKKYGFVFIKERIKLWANKISFMRKLKKQGLHFIAKFKDEKMCATLVKAMIADMLFNLAPKADVYKGINPETTEAIACIEALARVPQQVNKWGHSTTKVFMHELYKLYYGVVIPGCIKAYEDMTNKPYYFNKHPVETSFLYKLKQLFKKRNKPSREV